MAFKAMNTHHLMGNWVDSLDMMLTGFHFCSKMITSTLIQGALNHFHIFLIKLEPLPELLNPRPLLLVVIVPYQPFGATMLQCHELEAFN